MVLVARRATNSKRTSAEGCPPVETASLLPFYFSHIGVPPRQSHLPKGHTCVNCPMSIISRKHGCMKLLWNQASNCHKLPGKGSQSKGSLSRFTLENKKKFAESLLKLFAPQCPGEHKHNSA